MTLADYLASQGATATDLAARLKVSVSTVTRVANGEQKPSHGLIAAIFDKTQGAVTPNDFFDMAHVAMCGACDLHAASPEIRACTRTDCPMTGRVAQEMAA